MDVFTKRNAKDIENRGSEYFKGFLNGSETKTIAVLNEPNIMQEFLNFLRIQKIPDKTVRIEKIENIESNLELISSVKNGLEIPSIISVADYMENIDSDPYLKSSLKATQLTIGNLQLALVVRMYDETFAFRRRIKNVRDGVLEFEKIMRTEKVIRLANDYPALTANLGIFSENSKIIRNDGIFDFENEIKLIKTKKEALNYLENDLADVAICSISKPNWNERVSVFYSLMESGLVLVEKNV